jgi:hypothetical protein
MNQPPSSSIANIRTETYTELGATFELDPEMGPDMSAYGNCIAGSRGTLAPGAKPPVPIGGDCSEFRKRALIERLAALQDLAGLSNEERTARAEADLHKLEAFITHSAATRQ